MYSKLTFRLSCFDSIDRLLQSTFNASFQWHYVNISFNSCSNSIQSSLSRNKCILPGTLLDPLFLGNTGPEFNWCITFNSLSWIANCSHNLSLHPWNRSLTNPVFLNLNMSWTQNYYRTPLHHQSSYIHLSTSFFQTIIKQDIIILN